MAKYIVSKSSPLHGEVEISGSKNAVLPILAATILAEGTFVLNEVPHLKDVEIMCEILRSLGAEVKEDWPSNRLIIEMKDIVADEVPYELVKKMRASIFVMGPLLARMRKAHIALPGGCSIGDRPIDLHEKGMKTLGASMDIENGKIEADAPEGLQGSFIYLDFPSVGATENIMMAATLAEGITVIDNAAEEPEIVDLANFLNKMGAKVKGAGTDSIKIEGVKSLKPATHGVIPDRIETGTFMVAAAITRGNILIKNMVPDHVRPVIAKLSECGVVMEEEEFGIRVRADMSELIATDIKTLPYPGFPTDMQAQFMALLTTVAGSSTVIETVFENRFMHAAELSRMGANIRVEGKTAFIPGANPLKGAQVVATDLRAGAALVLAGLAAEGSTEVSGIYHIERGYDAFHEKLTALGANISREED